MIRRLLTAVGLIVVVPVSVAFGFTFAVREARENPDKFSRFLTDRTDRVWVAASPPTGDQP